MELKRYETLAIHILYICKSRHQLNIELYYTCKCTLSLNIQNVADRMIVWGCSEPHDVERLKGNFFLCLHPPPSVCCPFVRGEGGAHVGHCGSADDWGAGCGGRYEEQWLLAVLSCCLHDWGSTVSELEGL